MRAYSWCALLLLSLTACAMPRVGGAPIAPVERTWVVPTLDLYAEWWAKTEACAGIKSDMTGVTFYAVDTPSGGISLGKDVAHGWWVREGNRIYLPANALGEEWLVRHEMLHSLLQRGSHPNDMFVHACHLASAPVFRDSTLTTDPGNPQGH
jgi:hypothetical protein